MIKITVPATSANLGIGYDTLGMAVSLYSHFTFERADKLTITGCPEEFQNEDNLVYVSFVDALAAWGEPAFPVAIDIQTDVPVARGLGSSSTCVVAGIMAAAVQIGLPPPPPARSWFALPPKSRAIPIMSPPPSWAAPSAPLRRPIRSPGACATR